MTVSKFDKKKWPKSVNFQAGRFLARVYRHPIESQTAVFVELHYENGEELGTLNVSKSELVNLRHVVEAAIKTLGEE